MRRRLLMAVVSAGVLAGCGGEALTRSTQGLELGGVMHRSSFGREGLESDIQYYRERLAGLESERKPDREAISNVSDLVAKLEGLLVKDGDMRLQDTCGVSGYSLSASVSPGGSIGSATADASYVEFGPPSPWSKTLLTQAYARSSAGTQYASHSHTYSGAGTFTEPTSYAQTGPTWNCKVLSAYASISSSDCPGFYVAESDDYDSCQF